MKCPGGPDRSPCEAYGKVVSGFACRRSRLQPITAVVQGAAARQEEEARMRQENVSQLGQQWMICIAVVSPADGCNVFYSRRFCWDGCALGMQS